MVAEHRLWTVEEYHRLITLDVLHENEHVELIRGEIVRMAWMSSRHRSVVMRTNTRLHREQCGDMQIQIRGPIGIRGGSELRPDIAVVKARPDFYVNALPEPADVLLIIEVAEGSLEHDRYVKGSLYAQDRIPEYWLIDLLHDRVEVYRDPKGDLYRSKTIHGRSDMLAPLHLPGMSIRVEELIG